MQKTITAGELKAKIDSGADFVLVDTLKTQSYEARHVPKAVSIPESPEFVEHFEKAVKAPKDSEIIVYCSSETCGAHKRAADALEQAGYTNVVRFSGGLAGWENAGYEFAQ